MKKLLLLFILSICFSLNNFAQNEEGFFKNNALRINPISFANAEFQLAYERYFGERNSSIIISPSIILKESPEETIEGWKIMSQYRFYLSHFRQDQKNTWLNLHNYGFYAGVYGLYFDYKEDYMRYVYDEITQNGESMPFTRDITAFEGGGLVGLEVDITSRIQFDFFVGGGIRYSDVLDTYDEVANPEYYDSYGIFDPEYQGVKPKLGFMLGITF